MSENGKLLSELLQGRTLSSLANDMKINVSNLSRVLNGKGCSKSMAEKLNKYFNITKNGFVEEKRNCETEKQAEKEIKTVQPKTTVKKSYPKYEKGEFVLYSDGKVGQIRKIGFDQTSKSYCYGVRLVEWCRPEEYADHHAQYNKLDRIQENTIKIIKKEDILKYKQAYENSIKNKNSFKYNNSVNGIIDNMTSHIDNDDYFFKTPDEKEKISNLIDEWKESETKLNSDLTSDEKIVILKQIIYKLLSII